MDKINVLILYNNLFHYRIPIFKLLANRYNLTVAYSVGSSTPEELNFKIIKLPINKFGRFVIHKSNIHELCCNYDVVIAYGDIAWLKFSTLTFYRKNPFKIIYWSPGVSASYNKKFDEVTRWDRVRDFFYKRADALVFYTDYPINKYIKRGFNKSKLFVAPNTVEVYTPLAKSNYVKNSILFIGTLYMQKGILTLLENYKSAYMINNNLLPLNLIGGGDEFEDVKNWIISNRLEHKINVLGPIYNTEEKAKFFKEAFACISPFQAGLSVLESMGYGVPFVTSNDAITGGERLNITHNVNGVLLDNLSDLEKVIIDITQNKDKYISMGLNGQKYYEESHTPSHMANGLIEAIEYVRKK